MSRFNRNATAKEPVSEADAPTVNVTMRPYSLDEISSEGSAKCYVGHYTAKNWGGRHENEDRFMNVDDNNGKMGFHTVGVLDGHDSDTASDMVSRQLPQVVGRRLKEGQGVVEAYNDSMQELEDMLKKVHTTAGTCVLSCTVAGNHVWCSNLGDCRSCLVRLQACTEKVTAPKVAGLHWMSRDHKASVPWEKQRIEEAGGRVIDGRVEGLEPSRTIGDFDVKMQVKKGVISIVPEVRRLDMTEGSQAIVVCATDGVWDIITGQDVCDLIHARKDIYKMQQAIDKGATPDDKPLYDLAMDLVQFSIAKGSRDDCTAIAALITAPGKVSSRSPSKSQA